MAHISAVYETANALNSQQTLGAARRLLWPLNGNCHIAERECHNNMKSMTGVTYAVQSSGYMFWNITFLVCTAVIGSAALVTRQGGEAWLDPAEDWLWGVTGAAAAGTWDWALDNFNNLINQPTQPSTDPRDNQDNKANPPIAPTSDEIYIETTSPPLADDNCKAQLQIPGQDSNPAMNSGPCKVATAQIIHLPDCRLQDYNLLAVLYEDIETALSQMVGPRGFRTIRRLCGVFFYTAQLTQTDIETLEKLSAENLVLVEPDGRVNFYDSSTESPIKGKDAHNLEKRKNEGSLVSQKDARIDLEFISTPPIPKDRRNGRGGYYYYKKSLEMQPVLVYVVDTGANWQSIEFKRKYVNADGHQAERNVIKEWIYTEGITASQSDWDFTRQREGHGTCVAQKIGGFKLGVDKDPSMIIVKFDGRKSGALEALLYIQENLERRAASGETLKGFVVINLSFGWGGPGQQTEVKFNIVIKELIKDYQAIIVVAAGEDGTGTNRAIDSWPALFADLLPLIVVGAVDPANGKTYPWSPGGKLLTVTAPGDVRCQNELGVGMVLGGQRVGASFAAAMVTGMISTWLSDDELGDNLRVAGEEGAVANNVKRLIKELAWIRPGGTQPGVYNGVLYYIDPDAWPPRIPKPLPG